MHLLVVSFKNGDVNYFGPFPTLFLANEYADAIKADMPTRYARHHVASLIVPFKVDIAWK